MKPYLAEDIRVILDKLDEYVDDKGTFGIGPKPAKPDDQEPSGPTTPKDQEEVPGYDKKVVDILKKPAGLKKMVNNLNVSALMNFLAMPSMFRPSFRSAINSLRSDTPMHTQEQRTAMAVAFVQALYAFQSKLPFVTSQAPRAMAVAEDLDDTKIKNYMARNQQNPGNSDIDHIKNMISAVSKHGTPNEKKELGLTEDMPGAQPVMIIGYNSGVEKLADVANKPERKREVMGVLAMGDGGQPILRFTEKNETQVYTADWDPRHGWVADFD